MKRIIFLLSILLVSFTITSCTNITTSNEIENAPKLIDFRVENIAQLAYRTSISETLKLVESTSNDITTDTDVNISYEEVVVGEAPTLVIVCENSEKDTFLDLEIYDSYYEDTVFLYSGMSEEYYASSTTTMDLSTEIWTTTIKIHIPRFESFENRTISIRNINFFRQVINQNVEGVIEDDIVDTIEFRVSDEIPNTFRIEKYYYELEIWYYVMDATEDWIMESYNIPEDCESLLRLNLLQLNEDGYTSLGPVSDFPRYGAAYYIVPGDLGGKSIDWLYLDVFNEKIEFVLTTLDYLILEINCYENCSNYTLYCTFDSQDEFNGQTAEDIFAEINISGFNIVYNFNID